MDTLPVRLAAPFRPVRLLAGLVLAAVVFASALVPIARADAPPIREQDVRAFVAAVADASRDRDLERLAAALADDCRIRLRTRFGGQEHLTELDKGEYLAMLRDGFIALQDLERYDYQVGAVDVALDGAQAANVRAVVTETLVYGGRASTTVSEEDSRVERRDGRLVLVAVTATTSGPTQTAAR